MDRRASTNREEEKQETQTQIGFTVFPRTRVIYVYAVVIISLMLMAIFWFIFQQIVEAVQISSRALANNFGSTSPTYTLADQFITNLFTYFLVLMLIGMTYWAYIYSQRKGGEF